jgi:hypothetical protein
MNINPEGDLELNNLDKPTLMNARLVFQTMLETVKQMDFIPDDKEQYTIEIQEQIDSIDIELLSRGDTK